METTKMLIIPSPEGVFSRSSVKVASANTNSKYCKKGVNIKNASTYLNLSRGSCSCRCCSIAIGLLATAGVLASSAGAIESETLSNIPLELSGECVSDINSNNDCKKPRIQKPKSRKAESCTVKCVNTCIRGGEGEGPFNIRRFLKNSGVAGKKDALRCLPPKMLLKIIWQESIGLLDFPQTFSSV